MASTDEAIMSITSESGGTYAVNFNAQYNIDPTDRTELPLTIWPSHTIY
jgi:hypothetical protein